MSNNTIISCVVGTTDPLASLGLEVWIDNNKLFDSNHIQNTQTISFDISDDEAEHELRFVVKNKTSEHTRIDEAGDIISDARLTITDIKFDEIALGILVTEQAVYTHDFNGSGRTVQDQFFGEAGCNGTISLKFTTPIYLWLLENM